MKTFKLLAFAAVATTSAAAFAQYDSNRVNLWSQIPLTSMPNSPATGAGCTGYISPSGREYGIMGVRTGTVFVEITDPKNPTFLKLVTGSTSLWHENTVLGNYAYLVSDQTGAGIQIVDMTNIDTTHDAPVVATYAGNNLSTVHTIQANPQTKTLYVNGSNRGLVFLDATNPTVPVEVGRWTEKYVHDSLPVNYTSGPWAGKEILFACCGGNGLYILDVTNKSSVVVLSHLQYLANGGYCHSGMLTPDMKYFLINDELDETNGVSTGATTHVVNVQDLANPIEVTQFHNPLNVIDHNSMYQDGFMFLAAYRGGLRIYDPSNPMALQEIGYFDTYPGTNSYSFNGAWGTCAKFPSGNVIISDIDRGFFVVDPSEAKGLGVPIVETTLQSRLPWYSLAKDVRQFDGRTVPLFPGNSLLTFKTTSRTRNILNVSYVGYRKSEEVVTISLKNISTGVYEQVMAPALTNMPMTFVTGNLQGSRYIDADGKVYARMNVHGASRLLTSYGATDMIRIDVN